MEKDKRVLPLLGTETMIVKDIELKEQRTAFGEMLQTAYVELQFWGDSAFEYYYPQSCVLTLVGKRAQDAAKTYKEGDVIRCSCKLFVATKK